MAKIISPSGTVCTAEGELREKLLASGWEETKDSETSQKPQRTARKKTVKE